MNSSEAILLLERNQAAVDRLLSTFRACGITNEIFPLSNAADILAYLRGDKNFSDRKKFPRPCLLLLDLVEHQSGGLELIQLLRKGTKFERLPIIVLADDVTDRRIQAAFDEGANTYVLKGVEPEELKRILVSLNFLGDVLKSQDIKAEERLRRRARRLTKGEILEQMRQAVADNDPCFLKVHISKDKDGKTRDGNKS